MSQARLAYLVDLAEELLAGQVAIGWGRLASATLKGETTWIDPTPDQPGGEVATNYRRCEAGIEIEVTAYVPSGYGEATDAIKRTALVKSKLGS